MPLQLQRKRRRKESKRRRGTRKKEDGWTLTTATFAQVHKLRPLFSWLSGRRGVSGACLNRDAAEQRGGGRDAGRDGGGRCSAGESPPSITHQHLQVSPDWLKSGSD